MPLPFPAVRTNGHRSRRAPVAMAWLLVTVLAGCGGAGPDAPAAPAAPSFRDLRIPAGFEPATASVTSVRVQASAIAAGGGLPEGHADPRIPTWAVLSYADGAGTARTLAVVRWTVLDGLGDSGLRLELPAQVSRLQFDVYNARGAKSGSLSL